MKTLTHFILLAGLAGGLTLTVSAQEDDAAPNATNLTAEATAAPPAVEPAASRDLTPQPAAAASAEAPASATIPTNQPPAAAAPAAVAVANAAATNLTAEFPPGQGLRMNFREVPLTDILNYLSKAAGYVIKPKPGLSINGRVTAWSDQPLGKEEAVDLLKHVLNDNGYTVIQDGRILTIISLYEAKKNEIPVKKFRNVVDIPRNTDVATYVIPVHTLNPIALVRNLQPLLGSDTDLQANESANSLLMTDAQINIRRIAEIVTTLDSVSSSVNSIKVYRLNYADSKTLAGLVKELFPSSDTRNSNAGGGNAGNFARFGGGPGGAGGPMGFAGFGANGTASAGNSTSGQTPSSRVSAVSDDAGNALVVSAPEELVATIDQLVDKLDQPVDDITVVKLFHLTNADPGEMVDLLANLFPDENATGNGSGMPVQFGGFGPAGAAVSGGNTTSGQSDRTKKAGKVVAVADKRTQSVLVSTSRNLMPQIESMITELDASSMNRQNVHVVSLKNANAQAAMQIMQDLFAATTSSSSSSLQNDPLTTRSQNMLNSQMSSGAGSGTSGLNLGGTSSSSTTARSP